MNLNEDTALIKKQIRIIAALIVALFIWMSFSKMDVMAHADGKITPSNFVKTLQNLEGGIITDIHIKVGDKVKAGDLLFRLNSIQYNSDIESTRKQLDSYKVRTIRLMAEVNGKFPTFESDLAYTSSSLFLASDLEKSIPDVIKTEVAEYKIRQEKILQLNQFIALAEKEYQIIKRLTQEGLEPQTELIRSERSLAEKKQALRERKESALAEFNKISNEIRSREDSLTTLTDKMKRTDIISPIDGIVGRVFVTTSGGVLKPGDPLAEIVPIEDELIVEAKLKPSDVAFVRPNMDAKIKITAYDYAVFGSFDAKVKTISPDAILNDKGESFYTVQLISTKKTVDKTGKPLELLPGMMAQVDIITDQRTSLQYLFKPFKDISSTAFKER